MGIRTLANMIGAIAAVFVLICLHPLTAFAQDDTARAEAIQEADRQMMQMLHAVQLAVERYSVDYGACPAGIQALMDEGYLSSPPANPYFGLHWDAPERVVVKGLEWTPTPGAVVYHPYSTDGKTLDGYILLAAGMKGSDTGGLFAHDLFYGEPRWDSLHFFTENGKGDGRPESYILLLASPPLHSGLLQEVARGAELAPADTDERTKEALFAVQLALERYGVDHEVYPAELQTLVDLGYVYWPLNPYYGLPGTSLRVKECTPGEFIYGGLVYQPRYERAPGIERIEGYVLGICGGAPDGGMDAGTVVDGEWRFYDPFGDETTLKDGIPEGIILVLSSASALGGCEDGT